MLFCTVYPAKMKLYDSFSIAHPPEKRKAFFVNKRACRQKAPAARRALPSFQQKTALSAPLPCRNQQVTKNRPCHAGRQKNRPCRTRQGQYNTADTKLQGVFFLYSQIQAAKHPAAAGISCGGGHSDTFLRVRKQLSVIPSLSRDLSRMC